MLSLEMYTPKYKSDISDWLRARNIDPRLADDLPMTGFVVLLKGTPIASGHLRLIEGSYGMVDSLITDPEAPAQYRNEALDLIINQLFSFAKQLQLKQVIGLTLDSSTHMRAQRLGMTATSLKVLALPLASKGE